MRLRRTPLAAIATAVLSAGVLTAALLTTGTAAAQPARAAQPAGVPWSHVGPGWVLAQYTTAAPEGGKTGAVTLYLISPGGARYQLARGDPDAAHTGAHRTARSHGPSLGQTGRRRDRRYDGRSRLVSAGDPHQPAQTASLV